MIRVKYWIRNFFGFTRSQVNGFTVLLMLVTAFLFSEPLWQWWTSSQVVDLRRDKALLDSLIALWDSTERSGAVEPIPAKTLSLFSFDPNTATSEDFMKLGLSQPTAQRIIRYREKGGKFRIKSDFLKIYGVDSAFYRRTKTYIKLPEKRVFNHEKQPPRELVQRIEKPITKFDLNAADTAQLRKIYGIGEKLSLRIIKFRDVLGGFITLSQLHEVYGLDSAVIGRLKENALVSNDFRPKKINLNIASEKQLAAHPYLHQVARAIVSYRFQHGNFETVEDIRNVGTLDEQTVQKVIPYLNVIDEE